MKTVEFEAICCTDQKVAAIKILRHSTDIGLIDAKAAVEAAQDTWKRWRMTPEQFGLFMVAYCDGGDHFNVRSVRLVMPVPVAVDFTD